MRIHAMIYCHKCYEKCHNQGDFSRKSKKIALENQGLEKSGKEKMKRRFGKLKHRKNFSFRRLIFFFRPFVEKEFLIRYMKRVIAVSITKIRLFKPAKSRQRLYCEPSDLSVMANNAASGSTMRLFHDSE